MIFTLLKSQGNTNHNSFFFFFVLKWTRLVCLCAKRKLQRKTSFYLYTYFLKTSTIKVQTHH